MSRRHNAATLRIQRRLDQLLLEDLRVIAAEQAEEITELRRRLSYAEDLAESWREDALRAIDDAGRIPALTKGGHVFGLPSQGAVS